MANDHFVDSVERAQQRFDVIFDPLNRIHDPMDVAKISGEQEIVLQLEDVADLLEALRSTLISMNAAVTETAVNTRLLSQILNAITSGGGGISVDLSEIEAKLDAIALTNTSISDYTRELLDIKIDTAQISSNTGSINNMVLAIENGLVNGNYKIQTV